MLYSSIAPKVSFIRHYQFELVACLNAGERDDLKLPTVSSESGHRIKMIENQNQSRARGGLIDLRRRSN